MTDAFVLPERVQGLPAADRPEAQAVSDMLGALGRNLDWSAVLSQARPWVQAVRKHPAPFWALESLMREFPISSAEGLALMRLAEALLRVPDTETAVLLTADQLGRARFDAGSGPEPDWLRRLSHQAVVLSRKFLPDEAGGAEPGLWQRLGAQAVLAATVRAIELLGRQFVLGETLAQAQSQAEHLRKSQSRLCFSYDMLGEGARGESDAQAYLRAYQGALEQLAAAQPGGRADSPWHADGLSIKLSALHPRYEENQAELILPELLSRVWPLVALAAKANLNLTLDAEEAERLELSLDVFVALARRVAREHPGWGGLGLAVQAYQTRSLAVIRAVARLADDLNLHFMVRLVKGAYWDAEIKRAQELGLAHYPVFTHKQHTDLAYLACAQAMLERPDRLYPQFAGHNAGTLAAVLQLVDRARRRDGRAPAFELQRLHGMGEGIYREVLRDAQVACRVYAPVGEHRDLLAYLVRRLLENGANSSFVHQLGDPALAPEVLLASPLHLNPDPALPLPPMLFGTQRRNAAGLDLSSRAQRGRLLDAYRLCETADWSVPDSSTAALEAGMQALHKGQVAWGRCSVDDRAAVMDRAADALESRLGEFCALLVREARKTWPDAVSECREAVDFCRYYAAQARIGLQPQILPGPTGERNVLSLRGRGVFVCISPWNFPLAIFAGQVVAALVAGNAVAAKPAEQTPRVAQAFVALLHDAGVPPDALSVMAGPGETVGAALVAHRLTAGVCFTGSTAVAKHIQRSLAAGAGPIVPFIAETGGLNAMVVDATALPEQVIDAVVQSAFRSAGQRCSALRLLCVHESVAEPMLDMLAGAMLSLRVGDPADFSTDVGPLIDAQACAGVAAELARLEQQARRVGRAPLPAPAPADAIAPVAYEIESIGALQSEIFGPVLHVVRWRGDPAEVIERINALGYGLTLGLQTRIDSRAEALALQARVGNVYVNRNIIGAVVGVQPFGGWGLSGSGPKAGGPHYLPRFCVEQTVTVNTAAAGGNAELLAGL